MTHVHLGKFVLRGHSHGQNALLYSSQQKADLRSARPPVADMHTVRNPLWVSGTAQVARGIVGGRSMIPKGRTHSSLESPETIVCSAAIIDRPSGLLPRHLERYCPGCLLYTCAVEVCTSVSSLSVHSPIFGDLPNIVALLDPK